MKKILLGLMAATMVATGASAGRLNKDFTYTQAKSAYAKLEKASAICVGTAAIPYAGSSTCAGMLVEIKNDKNVKKVVNKKTLQGLKNLGVEDAMTLWLPFASVGFGAKAADTIIKIKKEMRGIYPELGDKIPAENDNTNALKHYRG